MGHRDPPIRHHNHQIPKTQFEARVPTHAQNDDLSVEVASLEHIFDRDEPLHLFIIARHPPVVHQSSTSRAARPATPDRLAQFLYFRRQSLNRLFQQTDRLHISSPTEKADHVAGVVRSLPDNHMAEDDFANALRKRRQISITVTGRCTGRAITIPVWFVAAIARSGSCR